MARRARQHPRRPFQQPHLSRQARPRPIRPRLDIPRAGVFDLLVNNDNEAEVFLRIDATEASLSSLGQRPLHAPPFADGSDVTTPPLTSSRRHLLRGVLKQGGGRARFSVKARTLASPVHCQWHCNGSPIPGATRPVFTTPVLAAADNNAANDVVVSVAGTDTTSALATLTAIPGEPGPLQAYVGVNFTGGYVSEDSVSLAPRDVAGVMPQANWTNTGSNLGPISLHDAAGSPSPVSLTVSTRGWANAGQWSSGSRLQGDADGDLMQGFMMFGTGTDSVSFTFDSVQAGTCQGLAYTLGLDFQADCKESFSVVGAAVSPTYYPHGETGIDYGRSPGFRRVTNTNPATWQKGNHVQFDNVRPAADGTLTLAV